MRVFALGATGFIGAAIVRRLAGEGHEVTVLHRGRTRAELPESVRELHGDRNEPEGWIDAVRAFAPTTALDVVLYTEAQARSATSALRGVADRLVALSSVDVYRNYDGVRRRSEHEPDPVPLDEDAPLRSRLYPYRGDEAIEFVHREEYEKILVERVVREAGEPAGTILRLPAVYGPGDRRRRLRPLVHRMADGRAAILLGPGEARWRWTRGYVENVAAAVAAAVLAPGAARRTYNVGDAVALSEREWAEAVGRAAGWNGTVREIPESELPKALRRDLDWRYELAADTRRLRDELGFRDPISQAEALAHTIRWERERIPHEPPIDYAAEDDVLARRAAAG